MSFFGSWQDNVRAGWEYENGGIRNHAEHSNPTDLIPSIAIVCKSFCSLDPAHYIS
jgi:hypothetical protein